jgi:hypothetical protein
MSRTRRLYVRKRCQTPVELRDVSSRFAGVLRDLSPEGACVGPLVRCGPLLIVPSLLLPLPRPGDRVQLVITYLDGSVAGLWARVVWTRGEAQVGLQFGRPLGAGLLESLQDGVPPADPDDLIDVAVPCPGSSRQRPVRQPSPARAERARA